MNSETKILISDANIIMTSMKGPKGHSGQPGPPGLNYREFVAWNRKMSINKIYGKVEK